MILILVVTFILWLIVEIVVAVFCLIIAIWCVLCRAVCWIGCLGNSACYENCLAGGTCDVASIEIDWSPAPRAPPPPAPPSPAPSPAPIPIPSPPPGPGPTTFSALPAARIVAAPEALAQLTRWRSLLLPAAPVWLEADHMREEERAPLQSAIDRGLSACGCAEGAVGLLVVLAMSGAFVLLAGTSLSVWEWAGFATGGAVLGKVMGIVTARARLRRVLLDHLRPRVGQACRS